jgi:hypothetical protein
MRRVTCLPFVALAWQTVRLATLASREYREEFQLSNLQFATADTDFVACSRFSSKLPISNCRAYRFLL